MGEEALPSAPPPKTTGFGLSFFDAGALDALKSEVEAELETSTRRAAFLIEFPTIVNDGHRIDAGALIAEQPAAALPAARTTTFAAVVTGGATFCFTSAVALKSTTYANAFAAGAIGAAGVSTSSARFASPASASTRAGVA